MKKTKEKIEVRSVIYPRVRGVALLRLALCASRSAGYIDSLPAALNREKRASRAFLSTLSRLCFGLSLIVYSLSLGHCANAKAKVFGDVDDGPKAPNPACSSPEESTGFNKGDGSSGSPFLICTYKQLAMMDDTVAALTAHYQLGDNFGATGNWTPIGESSTSSFGGRLDGGGYLIRNLTVNITVSPGTAYGGFFGYLGKSAEISNIALRDVSVTVIRTSGSGGVSVGMLAGENFGGIISNSYADGAVSAATTSSIDSASFYVSGLVGYNHADGRINNSYATGSVSTSVDGSNLILRSGGLVGWNNGTINSSYAAGSVSASVNGIGIGIGMITGLHSGGLVGELNISGTVSDSYWDTDSALHSDGCDDDMDCDGTTNIDDTMIDTNATGLRTMEMQDGSSASGLKPAFKLGGGYPKLYQCDEVDMTGVCNSFSTELLPGQ